MATNFIMRCIITYSHHWLSMLCCQWSVITSSIRPWQPTNGRLSSKVTILDCDHSIGIFEVSIQFLLCLWQRTLCLNMNLIIFRSTNSWQSQLYHESMHLAAHLLISDYISGWFQCRCLDQCLLFHHQCTDRIVFLEVLSCHERVCCICLCMRYVKCHVSSV